MIWNRMIYICIIIYVKPVHHKYDDHKLTDNLNFLLKLPQ